MKPVKIETAILCITLTMGEDFEVALSYLSVFHFLCDVINFSMRPSINHERNIFRKNYFLPPDTHEGAANVGFSKNFVNVLNGRSPFLNYLFLVFICRRQ